ncbi:MAG TPA: hypothetical protein VGI74_13005 [Streptosporangiaceae bacterium]|jgi:hypothetical protein
MTDLSTLRVHRNAAMRPRYRRRPPQPVHTVRVHPAVWVTALHLAAGDCRRLRILDAATVLVVNHPRGAW